MFRWLRPFAPCFAVVACVPTFVFAQSSPPDSVAPRPSRGWKAEPVVEATISGSDNVFLLAPNKRNDMDAISAAEAASGRYTDMESSTDFAPALEGALLLRGPGFDGRQLSVRPELRYEFFMSNTRRSNLRLALALEQSLPKDGRVRIRGRFTPEYFAKNYLADAVDLDGSETITPEERRYRAGTYAESQAVIDWRVRLARRNSTRPVGAALELGLGYAARSYEAPFAGRDLAGPLGSLLLDLDLGPRTALELEYDLEALGADPSSEVLLLDEPDFGTDFNGNGNATDLEVRTVQTVDRSRTEHSGTATLRLETSPRTDLEFFVGVRARSYGSGEPFDVGYRDRHDTRLALGGNVRVRLAPGVSLTLGGEHRGQSTNRAGDPGSSGDEDDYRQNTLFATLAYRRRAS